MPIDPYFTTKVKAPAWRNVRGLPIGEIRSMGSKNGRRAKVEKVKEKKER